MWVPEFFGTMAYVTKHPEAKRCGDWDDPRMTKLWSEKDPCILANINLDMIGEDTVKTNSRFYATRTPDSVPSYLDALLTDLMQQTREANLYAPAGTRNYWQPEMIDYTQGSDHDVFNGLGIPSSMFGHDPDWTHHSSEDNIDKTDASEFRRVGTMAGAAVWWIAAQPLSSDLATALTEAGRTVKRGNLAVRARFAKVPPPGANPNAVYTGLPRRLTLLPVYGAAFESISGEDKKWWDEQDARFSHVGEGLATEPDFGLIVYEAMNFMSGGRNTKEIADLLNAEYLTDLDEAWVVRLVRILSGQGLVTYKSGLIYTK